MAVDPMIARGTVPIGEGWANTLLALENVRQDRQRNALAEGALTQRNAEFQYGQQQDANALKAAADKERAMNEIRGLHSRLSAGDDSALAEIAQEFPALAQLAQRDVGQARQAALAQLGGILGIKGDSGPLEISEQAGPFGSKVLKGSDGRWQVVEPPRAPSAAAAPEMPSSIREWQEYQKMSPEEQRAFLALRRSNSTPEAAEELARAKALGSAAGKAEGEARSELPMTEMNADNMLGVLRQFKESKGTRFLFGGYSLGPIVPDTPQADASAIYDQILGKAFLQAFETLKGGGQITEAEGTKATAAITRLQNRRQSYGSAMKAVKELEEVVTEATKRARQKAYASKPQPAGAPEATPAVEDPLGIRQ